jgi:hypothetical protein
LLLVETLWQRLDRADEERQQVQARLNAILKRRSSAPSWSTVRYIRSLLLGNPSYG